MWNLFRTAAPRISTPTRVQLSLEPLDFRSAPSSLFDPLLGETASPIQLLALNAPAQTVNSAAVGPTETVKQTSDPTTVPITDFTDAPTKSDDPPMMTMGRGGGGGQNQPPVIINFSGVQVEGNYWLFSGDVLDEAPGDLTIWFGGEPASLENETTVTDANGHFEFLVELNTNGSDDGIATAQTVDIYSVASNVATVEVTPSI